MTLTGVIIMGKKISAAWNGLSSLLSCFGRPERAPAIINGNFADVFTPVTNRVVKHQDSTSQTENAPKRRDSTSQTHEYREDDPIFDNPMAPPTDREGNPITPTSSPTSTPTNIGPDYLVVEVDEEGLYDDPRPVSLPESDNKDPVYADLEHTGEGETPPPLPLKEAETTHYAEVGHSATPPARPTAPKPTTPPARPTAPKPTTPPARPTAPKPTTTTTHTQAEPVTDKARGKSPTH
jgi:hypothetical protein